MAKLKTGNLIMNMLGFMRPLTRLKVFYQICIIIVVMLVVIVFMGINSFSTIDTMGTVVDDLYKKSTDELNNINTATQSLEAIRTNYLEVLSNTSKTGRLMDAFTLEDRVFQIQSLKKYSPDAVDRIAERFSEVIKLMRPPATPEKYEQLTIILEEINTSLVSLQTNVIQTSTDLMADANNKKDMAFWVTIITTSIGFLLSVIIGIMIASSISIPLRGMVDAAKSLATGDLTENINAGGSAEVAAMAGGLNQAIHGLRDLVRGINEQSNTLSVASKELSEASTDTGQSALQVARAMEELAKATNEQTTQINQAVETINLLSGLVRKVSTDTEMIALASEKVANSAKMGQKATGNVANEINDLFESTKEVAEVIGELNKTSEEISDITAMIEGIAEQTTLLALNASIEAARAGEQGKGFSVVAKETGKLAEQSKQAAKTIESLINQMRERTHSSVEAIQKGIQKAESGKNLIDEANITFVEIFRDLTNNLEQIEAVAKSARQMAKSNDGVINAITTIAAIAEETMASTQEVSATAQQQTASVEQVTALSENLAQIANQLKRSISAFDIGEKH